MTSPRSSRQKVQLSPWCRHDAQRFASLEDYIVAGCASLKRRAAGGALRPQQLEQMLQEALPSCTLFSSFRAGGGGGGNFGKGV